MATIPLGLGAYKRTFAGEPEVELINRFLEKNPTNLREKVALISRSGTNLLMGFADGLIRRCFSKRGFMGGDLFVVSGGNLWRYDGTHKTQITGLINGTGSPQIGWMKGIGYEYLFITDGLLFQYYPGGSHGTGTMTYAPGSITTQVIEVGGVYYSWNASVDTNAPDGSSAHPWLCAPGADPLLAMAKMLNFDGVRGTDFSTALGGPNPAVSASVTDTGGNAYGSAGYTAPAVHLLLTSASVYADANTITTSVFSGSYLTWRAAHLTGGGTHALSGVGMPDGVGAKALASCSGFVLVSVANSQKFYWLEPGTVAIDPLNFAEKESSPDNIVDMISVGDQVIIAGDGSTENWYATGNADVPWAPVQGRVYQRGVLPGSMCVVTDSVLIVGDDGIAYSLGYGYSAQAQVGVHRVSDHGIEERIRTQLRREQGLMP